MPQNREATDFFDCVQHITERYLTNRANKRRIKKEKKRNKNPIVDWIEAFLWAAGWVLLINQYAVQAYQIPSGSMIDTLNIGDHVFINKYIYGPELLPGIGKLPSLIKPKRNDIIIFENPTYISRGPVFDIAQRIIFMLTLSFVDIDRDNNGEPRVHFLIKRSVGSSGDHFKMEQGNMRVRFAGEDRWVDELDYASSRSWKHKISRLVKQDEYQAIIAAGEASAFMDMGLPIPQSLRLQTGNINYIDYLAHEKARIQTLRKLVPSDSRYAALFSRYELGWYVSDGRVLPLGDNRDNSRDGRYFGPVRESKILGKGMIIYWPLFRVRGIK